MFLFWPLVGAVIGYAASQRRGYSAVAGTIAGALLGPLAFLPFFVSGIFSASEAQRKCPYCAEWIKPTAVVCKHCHRDVPPVPKRARAKPKGAAYGCEACGKTVRVGESTCQWCGASLVRTEQTNAATGG